MRPDQHNRNVARATTCCGSATTYAFPFTFCTKISVQGAFAGRAEVSRRLANRSCRRCVARCTNRILRSRRNHTRFAVPVRSREELHDDQCCSAVRTRVVGSPGAAGDDREPTRGAACASTAVSYCRATSTLITGTADRHFVVLHSNDCETASHTEQLTRFMCTARIGWHAGMRTRCCYSTSSRDTVCA